MQREEVGQTRPSSSLSPQAEREVYPPSFHLLRCQRDVSTERTTTRRKRAFFCILVVCVCCLIERLTKTFRPRHLVLMETAHYRESEERGGGRGETEREKTASSVFSFRNCLNPSSFLFRSILIKRGAESGSLTSVRGFSFVYEN